MATKRKKTAAAKKTKAAKTTRAPKTKAKAEFDRYKARAGAGPVASAAGALGTATPGLRMGAPIPAVGAPPSVAPLLQQPLPQLPTGPSAVVDPAAVSERLGSTLRLGVELLNATLASSLRLLDGVTGMTSGVADALWQQGGYPACGCGYDDSCNCSSYDCCCAMGCDCGCCQPSVGSCC